MDWALSVTAQDLDRFCEIRDRFLDRTEVPEPGRWRDLAPDEVWYCIVNQIVVIGSSAASERLAKSKDRSRLYSSRLAPLSDAAAKAEIHEVFRRYGVRYVGEDPEKAWKIRAVLRNLNNPQIVEDGQCILMQQLEGLEEHTARDWLVENLDSYGLKSASDTLSELGFARNLCVFDSRVITIFERCFGLPHFFSGAQISRDLYLAFEAHLVEQVCPALELEPVAVDRLLYQNYQAILRAYAE